MCSFFFYTLNIVTFYTKSIPKSSDIVYWLSLFLGYIITSSKRTEPNKRCTKDGGYSYDNKSKCIWNGNR